LFCVVAAAQNSVCSDALQSPNRHYRKPADRALSKENPRKRITMMFNVSFHKLLLSDIYVKILPV